MSKQATSRSPFFMLAALLAACWGLAAAAGQLFLVEFQGDDQGSVTSLAGASDVALSADGLCLYVTADLDHAMTTFDRVAMFGSISFDESHDDEEDGEFGLLGASSVAASPDGRNVYVTGGADDSLLVYRRDATSDSHVFVAEEVKENLVGGVIGMDGPSSVAVSGDSESVFVTAALDDAISVYRRDASSDALAFVEAEFDGVGADGLDGASDVALSPDHQYLYVTGKVDDAVVVFARQPGGGIQHVASYFDGDGDIEGLNGASGVAVSPDGAHVYVVGAYANSLVRFRRNPYTGRLTFEAAMYDGQDGVEGLGGAADVVVNAQGDRVLVAAADDNAVSLFRRTPATGALLFLDSLTMPVGLRGARSLAATADGVYVYVAAHADNGVAGLYVAPCEGDEASGDADHDAVCEDQDQCLGDDFAGDGDGDDVCDDIDACPGYDDGDDMDSDTVPDGCDLCEGDDASGDSDSDEVCDDSDLCPGFDDDIDSDLDGVADGCDLCLGHDLSGDTDGDGVCDNLDVCAGFDDGADADGDLVPDGCDACLGNDLTGDADGDAVCNDLDVCPGSDDTLDEDGDAVPDGCDLCQGADASGDSDGDLVCDDLDCAPNDPTTSQVDACGVCGGTATVCPVFFDGFESGDTSAWSAVIGAP